jgi:hypothetical protein
MRETLIVLGMAALFILGVVGTVGALEFRPARAVSASARRKPGGVESRRAAGTVPDAGGAWPGGPASGTAGPRLLTTAELAVLHPRAHRPVNGRLLGDQPRTYGQVPVATVLDAERQASRAEGVRARLAGVVTAPDPHLLERVRDGLLALPPAPAVYPCCDHCDDCDLEHAKPCRAPGCPGAEPAGGAR